jgi:hypothetical protein
MYNSGGHDSEITVSRCSSSLVCSWGAVSLDTVYISRKDHQGTSDQRNLQNAPLQEVGGMTDLSETVK